MGRTALATLRRIAPLGAGLALACATSPLGRSQLILFSDADMAAMGVAAYDQLKTQLAVSNDERATRYVRCVADAITAELRPEESTERWEVTLFEEPSANAFALPGGKIGVHTGLLDVATNQDQLATVIGHEVAHVLARHANERVSTAAATQSALQVTSAIAGGGSGGQKLMGALGVGAEVGVILPFSRSQESEADLLGLDLMARAGFDPRQSVRLWENMASAAGGAQPPEFLSTHPSHGTRIRDLQERIPQAMPSFERARAAGRRPSCS